MDDQLNLEGFPYVVQKVEQAAICFGSKLHRDTNPIGKGLSPFQKRYGNSEIITKITPQTYNLEHLTSGVYMIQNKVRSNRGLSGLASRAPRMIHKVERIPSPTRYNVLPKRTARLNKVPFNSNSKRFYGDIEGIPGPGTYKTETEKCRRTGLQSNFGRPTVEPAYEVKCIDRLEDRCIKCKKLCDLDYWHLDYSIYLCHFCMEEELMERDMFKYRKLKKFKRIRTCTFVHEHQGTSAKIILLEREMVAKKLRKENYLKKYFV